jgi:hypothetical protein
VSENSGRLCTYHVGGYGQFGALRQFVEMGRAQNLQAFQAAWALQQVPCFHVVYADKQGNIFYLYNSLVGNKAVVPPAGLEVLGTDGQKVSVIDWNAPLPAENTLYTWGPILPASAMPTLLNPTSGYVQACGNPPWLATDQSGLDPSAIPPWFAQDDDSFRARRARQLLRLGARSFDEMQAMLYDTLAPFAVEAAPALIAAADGNAEFVGKAHPDLPVGLDLLRSWSYTADADSTGTTFFHVWWTLLQEAAAPQFRSQVQLMDAVRTKAPELQDLTLQAASEAAKRMRNEYQNLSQPWGEVHRLARGDKNVPLEGDDTGDTLFYNSDLRLKDGKWTANYGYGYAMVVRFGEKPEAVSVSPFGASELSDSPHYADQMDLLTQHRFKPAYFELNDVLLHAQYGFGRSIEFHPAGLDGRIVLSTAVPVKARLETSAEPPAPLPEELGTFTVYSALRDVDAKLDAKVSFEARVPEDICDKASLDKLAVYAYDESGWQRVDEQQVDADKGLFTARDGHARLYAVLGPAKLRKTEDAPKPVVPAPPARPAYEGVLEAAREHPEEKPAETLVAEGAAPPLVPTGTKLAEEKPEEKPVEMAKAEPTVPAPAPSEPAATPTPAPEPQKVVSITNDVIAKAEANAAPKAAEAAQQQTQQKTLLTDMKPSALGPPAGGKELGLWTPDMTSMFLFSAKMNCEARLVTLPQSPARLPEGMAVFSPYLGLERSPIEVKGDLAMKIIVSEKLCASENLGKLKLYGYTDDKGWYEAGGQKVGTEDRSVSGLDNIVGKDLRLYAVLGPLECRKK